MTTKRKRRDKRTGLRYGRVVINKRTGEWSWKKGVGDTIVGS